MPTYRIDEKQPSRDPELYLKNLLDIELKDEQFDFAIVSVGANDISDLDIEATDFGTLTNVACDHSKDIVHLAGAAAKKFNLEMFVVERAPRLDDEKDTKSMRNDLTRSANGLYMSLVAVTERVHLISLPSLSSFSGKARRDCFDSDGLHTNGKGSANLCFDLISGVKSVFTDIATKKPNTNDVRKLKGGVDLKDGQRDVRVNKGQGAGGRSHGHSRGGQQWNGQPYRGGGGGYRGGWQQDNQWRGRGGGGWGHNDGGRDPMPDLVKQYIMRSFMDGSQMRGGRY